MENIKMELIEEVKARNSNFRITSLEMVFEAMRMDEIPQHLSSVPALRFLPWSPMCLLFFRSFSR